MTQLSIDDERLKNVFKEAIIEIIDQKRDLIHDIVTDAIEDIALSKAIDEGDTTESISKDEIYDIIARRS